MPPGEAGQLDHPLPPRLLGVRSPSAQTASRSIRQVGIISQKEAKARLQASYAGGILETEAGGGVRLTPCPGQ